MRKYQTLITTAFQDYPAKACIEYDCRFRQLAAKDKRILWDKYKEDIFVWCFSPQPASTGLGNATETRNYFHYSTPLILSHFGLATDTIIHTSTRAKKCICFNTTRAVQEERHASSNTFATREGVEGNTQPVGVPPSSSPRKQIIAECLSARQLILQCSGRI